MTISSNKSILKNTLMLYFRQVLSLLVSLYTIRVVLDVLGVEDYGIYTVVGGVVTFFTFLKGSMSEATQRFYSIALGQNNLENSKKIFSINLIIYFLMAIFSLILMEVLGFWFVKHQLKIPLERVDSAIFIYHFSVLTFFLSIICTPLNSAILSHEDMSIYAYVSILEVTFKLVIVFTLTYLPFDKLELYGVLTFLVSTVVSIIYLIICLRKYDECQFKIFYWDKKMFYEIMGFTSWTLFGQICYAFRNQAVLILVNQFFNPIVVAANAIARNITIQIQLFSNNFNTSLYPPIIKSYAIDDKKNMFSLIFNGSKITFFLMWIFALPFYIEMEAILQIWLKEIPQGTFLFTRLALTEVLIHSISLPIITAARAPGKMKWYEPVMGGFQLTIFLASWLFLNLGSEASIILVIAIIVNCIMFVVRLLLVRHLIGLSPRSFAQQVVLPIFRVVLSSYILSLGVQFLLPKNLIFSFITIIISIVSVIVCIYYIGLDKIWRVKLTTILLNKIIYNNKSI